MPYIISKKNGKPYKLPGKPTARDIPVWSRDDVDGFDRDGRQHGDCWTLTNVVTRRSIRVGACKNPTPTDLWGARGRKRRRR